MAMSYRAINPAVAPAMMTWLFEPFNAVSITVSHW
jgi:hypothetical protein